MLRQVGMADLRGVRAKYQRACTHAQGFDSVAQEIFNKKPFDLVGGTEGSWFVSRWKQNGDYPDLEPLSLIFGDMLYNLRASLDYIVWQLVLENGRKPDPGNTGFPCIRNSKDWKSALGSQLKGVDKRWADEIKRFQPFDSQHQGDPAVHPLALLNDANNVSKHQLLPVAIVQPLKADYTIEGLEEGLKLQFETSNDPIVTDGSWFFRFTADRPRELRVTIAPNPRFRLKFTGITSHNWQNWDLVNWVGEVIDTFEPAFSAPQGS
jgi:hypothetical protein